MSSESSQIDSQLADFIRAQKLFFVATAPLDRDGHVNVSPKGLDSLRILDERTVAYLDLTGSGAETIAHVRENERIVLMLCAFAGTPRIVRLHGRGEVVTPDRAEFHELRGLFPAVPGARSIIRVRCERISDSCGLAVPLYEFVGERDGLVRYAEKMGPEGMADYRRRKNARSLDGLPALPVE